MAVSGASMDMNAFAWLMNRVVNDAHDLGRTFVPDTIQGQASLLLSRV